MVTQRILKQLRLPALVVCWSWLVFHFLCTTVYLAPTGTVQAGLYELACRYMRPRFSQRWALFAPDPDGKTRHFQVRCRIERPDGGLQDTPFYDVTERFYASPWHTRLGPDGRLLRAYLSTLMPLDRDDKTLDVLRYRAKADPALRETLERRLERVGQWRSEYARRLAARIGSAECRRQFPEAKIAAVTAALDLVRPQPYFTSDPAPPDPQRVDFGWQPYAADLRGL